MSFYLPVALLFAGLLSFLCYYAYAKDKPSILLWGGLLMVTVLRLMTSFYPYIWNTDEAEWVSLTRTLPYCDVPYKCFDAHSTGFMNILMFKPLEWLGINYTYSSLRIFGLFVFIIPSILLFYYSIRRLYPNRSVILALGLLFHYFLFASYCYDMFSYHSEYSIMFFTALTYYCYIEYTHDKKFIYLVLAALCLGLMPFFKLQSAPLVLGFTIVFFLHFFKRKKIVHGLVFCAIGVLPLAVILLYFWKEGVLNDFWQMYIVSNQYLVKYFTDTSFFGKIKVFVVQQRWQFAHYLVMAVLIFMAFYRKRFTKATLRQFSLPSLILLACAYVASGASGQGMQHYLTLVAIPLFLVVTDVIFVLNMEQFLQHNKRRIQYSIYLAGSAALLLLLPEIKKFRERRYHDRRPDSVELVKYVDQQVPEGKPICVLGWYDAVEIQVAFNRPLATRTAHNYYLLADKDPELMAYYHKQYIADLDSSRPFLVIDPLRTISWEGGTFRELDDKRMAPIRQYIEEKYTKQDTLIDNCVIYKRKEP